MCKVKDISSPANAVIKRVNKLKRKKDRDIESCYLIEGFNLTVEALKTDSNLETVLLKESLVEDNNEGVRKLIDELKHKEIDIYVVADNVFDRITDTITPQGILAVVRKRIWNYNNLFAKCGNLIVLDRLQDPGNVGTILRTADAAGYQGAIILKGTVDVYSMKVVRAAAGSIFRFPLHFAETTMEAIELLKKNNKLIVATTPYCEQYYFENDLAKDIALVIGNEGSGISDEFLNFSDAMVKIPMNNQVESLNAAVASAIIIYESVRQKYNIKDGGTI
ncbi:MAG: RNA methyltransferase [Clostridiales bacterium]|nr:RNA methyltransferase [Clostridiales bacterium]